MDVIVLLFGSELGLTSSLLLEQRLVLGLELGVDERTPLRADLPLQFSRAAEGIPEAPARLPTNIPVRHGIGLPWDGVVERGGSGSLYFKDLVEVHRVWI